MNILQGLNKIIGALTGTPGAQTFPGDAIEAIYLATTGAAISVDEPTQYDSAPQGLQIKSSSAHVVNLPIFSGSQNYNVLALGDFQVMTGVNGGPINPGYYGTCLIDSQDLVMPKNLDNTSSVRVEAYVVADTSGSYDVAVRFINSNNDLVASYSYIANLTADTKAKIGMIQEGFNPKTIADLTFGSGFATDDLYGCFVELVVSDHTA